MVVGGESSSGGPANAGKRAAYEYRRDLLGKAPRHLRALNLAASKAGWGTPLPTGRSRGIAVYKSRSEEHTSELQSRPHLVCRLLLEKKKKNKKQTHACT